MNVNIAQVHPTLIETLTFYVLEGEESYVPVTRISGLEMVRWCCHALELGLDCPALRMAAGLPLDSARFEAEPYLVRAPKGTQN